MLQILSNANRRKILKFRLQFLRKDGSRTAMSRYGRHSDLSVVCGRSAEVTVGVERVRRGQIYSKTPPVVLTQIFKMDNIFTRSNVSSQTSVLHFLASPLGPEVEFRSGIDQNGSSKSRAPLWGSEKLSLTPAPKQMSWHQVW